jgi:hypothetical protein
MNDATNGAGSAFCQMTGRGGPPPHGTTTSTTSGKAHIVKVSTSTWEAPTARGTGLSRGPPKR